MSEGKIEYKIITLQDIYEKLVELEERVSKLEKSIAELSGKKK
jgi:uncharacterized coiled-coil protein SlyX